MKPRLLPPGCVGIVVNRWAIDASPACSARTGWQAGAATQAGSMLPDPSRVRVRLQARTATQAGSVLPQFPAALPATPLPGEKIHPFHPGCYGLGLV
jgi:hypothetical protein